MTEFASSAATPFEVLGQEVRIGILQALVRKRVEDPQQPIAAFSELRERVALPIRDGSAITSTSSYGLPILEIECNRCGHYLPGPISLVGLLQPVLQAFYLERDIDVRNASL